MYVYAPDFTRDRTQFGEAGDAYSRRALGPHARVGWTQKAASSNVVTDCYPGRPSLQGKNQNKNK